MKVGLIILEKLMCIDFALLVLDSIIYRNDEMLKKAVLRTLIKNIKPIYEEKFQSSYSMLIDWETKN